MACIDLAFNWLTPAGGMLGPSNEHIRARPKRIQARNESEAQEIHCTMSKLLELWLDKKKVHNTSAKGGMS
jgi:hypothetical protein